MKPIQRGELLGLAEYEQIRDRFRARVIAEKKLRRVQLGPRMSAVFENRDTALLQIQEMLRTERITRPDAVQHEVDTYNELVPGPAELSCTLMVEIPDKAERDAFLVAAAGLEDRIALEALGVRIPARPTRRDGTTPERTTAVHYLKFVLPPAIAQSLKGAASQDQTVTHVELVVDHPAYAARAVLPLPTLASLGQDLADA